MAGTTMTQLPSFTWALYQAEVAANPNPEPALGHAPTWPAQLEPPNHTTTAHPQPNLCLQLTQILEWEIWNHGQTRARLCSEQTRCEQLENQIWTLEHDLAQWRQSCDTVYAALNEHRAEHTDLQRDMEGVLAEVAELRQQQKSKATVIEAETLISPVAEESGRKTGRSLDGEGLQKSEDGDESGPGASWRLGFIREIEDHLGGRAS